MTVDREQCDVTRRSALLHRNGSVYPTKAIRTHTHTHTASPTDTHTKQPLLKNCTSVTELSPARFSKRYTHSSVWRGTSFVSPPLRLPPSSCPPPVTPLSPPATGLSPAHGVHRRAAAQLRRMYSTHTHAQPKKTTHTDYTHTHTHTYSKGCDTDTTSASTVDTNDEELTHTHTRQPSTRFFASRHSRRHKRVQKDTLTPTCTHTHTHISAGGKGAQTLQKNISTHITYLLLQCFSLLCVTALCPTLFAQIAYTQLHTHTSTADSKIDFTHTHTTSYFINVRMPLGAYVYSAVCMSLWHLALLSAIRCVRTQVAKRVYALFNTFCVVYNVTACMFGGSTHKLVLFPDIWVRLCAQWVSQIHTHAHTHTYVYALIAVTILLCVLDVCAMIFQIKVLIAQCNKKCWMIVFGVVGAFLFLGCCFMLKLPKCTGNDHHWVNFGAEKRIREFKAKHFSLFPHAQLFGRKDHVYTDEIYRYSKYVPMRDGVQLAVDTFLPAELVNNHLSHTHTHGHTHVHTHVHTHNSSLLKVPTMIQFTRYNREMTSLWPFTVLPMWMQPQGTTVNTWSWQMVKALAPNGYAIVMVDVRGTGASFGTRYIDFSEEETRDFKEIVDWVKSQDWSNGHVAAGGISYDGMSGMQAAAQGGVDAVVSLFTPMDVVSDLIQPGGMVCSSFVDDYSRLTAAFEKRGNPASHVRTLWAYPWHIILGFHSAFNTPTPVLYREHDLYAAVQQHQQNWFMPDLVRKVRFKDDTVMLKDGRTVIADAFGITQHVMQGLATHKVPSYIVGGYCDSSSVRGSSRLFSHLQRTVATHNSHTKNSKLILGPWTHTGRRNCSPGSGSYSCFEEAMYYDVLRFLDCQLGDNCWGNIKQELTNQNVHYWKVAEERWATSDVYPPRDLEYSTFHFTGNSVSNKELIKHTHTHTDTHTTQTTRDWQRGDLATYANEVADMITSVLYRTFNKPHKASVKSSHTHPHGRTHAHTHTAKPTVEAQYKLAHAHTHTRNYTHTLTYDVDYTASSGFPSRWAIAEHPFRVNVDYSTRDSQHYKTLNFVTGALETDMAMTGSAWVHFSLALDALPNRTRTSVCVVSDDTRPHGLNVGARNSTLCAVKQLTDVTVFAYLEDVNVSTGKVTYVTEGRILLSHRTHNIFESDTHVTVGSPDVVFQPGTRNHFEHTKGGLETVSVSLEPLSYTFKAGHAVRLSLAGADTENFIWAHTADKYDEVNEVHRPANWRIHMAADSPAWIKLPVHTA